MAEKIKLSLPTVNTIIKTAIALAIIMFAVRMTPDTWGVKRWFMAV